MSVRSTEEELASDEKQEGKLSPVADGGHSRDA
jgi:hypothetical protein